MPSIDNTTIKFSQKDKQMLLTVARHAIQFGILYHKPPIMELHKYSTALQSNGAAFVTLKESNRLRGCIGTLQAYQALVQDVANNAFAAAFSDRRFHPVDTGEEPLLHISISVLSEPQSIHAKSEDELLSQLKPDEDGLILQYNNQKGTFLPAVWQQLPSPKEFLEALKQKAGLEKGFWSPDIKFFRYTSMTID